MKNIAVILFWTLMFQSCKEEVVISSINPVNWDQRTVEVNPPDSLTHGSSYLSVYSQIYSQTERRTHDLTVTVSMKNINKADTVYINRAEYFDTGGNLIRTYFDQTIFIAPLETVEIVIDKLDKEGGTGANFLFDWTVKPASREPFFEGVMISTGGQQGLSFTTQGKRITMDDH